MFFKRIKSAGLAHYSYFIADQSEAIVIDPRRDIDVYLHLAREGGFRITKVLETHRNEDYVIGSTALHQATGAEVIHGQALDWGYGTKAGEGDEFGCGMLRFKVLETPGHTLESLSYTVADTRFSSSPILVFTGDSLFVGDTGRIDLLGQGQEREAAVMLYESLFRKILPLGDHVILCPAHGGGSVCGGAIADRDESTLGYERLYNPKICDKVQDQQSFIQLKLAESHVQAPYFKRMEEWNQQGNAPIYERLPSPLPLLPGAFAERMESGAVVADLRMPHAFAAGHIPGSYNIWKNGISAYFGWIMPLDKEVLLVLPEEAAIEQVTRQLLRIGYDNITGYLRGGFESWQNEGCEIDRHETIDTHGLKGKIDRGEDILIIDVRKPSEWEHGSIDESKKIFVGELEKHLMEVPKEKQIISMCSVGHRGGIAASLLTKHGFTKVYNYLGGYTAWKESIHREHRAS